MVEFIRFPLLRSSPNNAPRGAAQGPRKPGSGRNAGITSGFEDADQHLRQRRISRRQKKMVLALVQVAERPPVRAPFLARAGQQMPLVKIEHRAASPPSPWEAESADRENASAVPSARSTTAADAPLGGQKFGDHALDRLVAMRGQQRINPALLRRATLCRSPAPRAA